uniref:C2H2-type domain-containing protein n=1 Tax=Clastoptera arizonana TaxID=38151 RepID=A0A1B6DMA3_9HEMI
MVCSNCLNKLEGVHKFVVMANKMQNRLSNFISSESIEEPSSSCGISEEDINHTSSLLHSILTNGKDSDGINGNSKTTEVTEVEVRVDPMLYFCDLDESSDLGPCSEVSNSTNDESDEPTKEYKPYEIEDSNEVASIVSMKDVKPYQCSVCPRGFHSEISLQNHLWSHLSRKVLSNTDLNKRLSKLKKGSVYSSNGVLHTIAEAVSSCHPYLCPICGKQISTKGNLKVHLETHRPKGKYGCEICGRVFKTQSNLYRHKEYHGEVQFECPTCGRVYPTKSTLRAHSITHSDLRPHKCPLCDKTFKRNQDLKFHINQHTGARPYQCPYCPKAFASSGNCFSHRKRMHPSEVERDREMVDEMVQ